MASPKNSIPSYFRQASGRARVSWTDHAGIRRFAMLPGQCISIESNQTYARFRAELEATSHRIPTIYREGITVAEMIVACSDHAERHYRHPDGVPTSEL